MYDMRDIDHLLHLYRVSMIWIGKKDRKEGEKKGLDDIMQLLQM